MKKALLVLVGVTLFGLSSCEKCSTCTFQNDDGTEEISEFCGRGHIYRDQLDQHERTGWNCSDTASTSNQ